MMVKIQVNLICGFLGAGKTTLLNHLLNDEQFNGDNTMVMVNDFGAINIDSKMVVSAEQKVIALTNGCLCCSIEDDLVQQLQRLATQAERPTQLIIETSGVADPSRVLHSLTYPQQRQHYQIQSVICVVDSQEFNNLPPEQYQLAQAQLSIADIIVLNKSDLLNTASLRQFEEQWISKESRVLTCSYGKIPTELLFGDSIWTSKKQSGTKTHKFSQHSWTSQKPQSWQQLKHRLQQLPDNVYRVKGFVALQEKEGHIATLQMVGKRINLELEPSSEVNTNSELVFIGWGDEKNFHNNVNAAGF